MSDVPNDDRLLFPCNVQPTVRVVAMPADTNAGGHIFGGWIMSQMDIAGSVVAVEYAASRVVTVAVTSMEFHKPVHVGDLISCFAKIEKIGSRSLTIKVEVFAQRARETYVQYIKVTEAVMVYVAVNPDGTPKLLPKRDLNYLSNYAQAVSEQRQAVPPLPAAVAAKPLADQ